MRTKLHYLVALLVLSLLTAGATNAGQGAGISPAQKERLKALAMSTRDQMEQARKDLMSSRMDLWDVYSNFKIDERRLKTDSDRISKRQWDLLNLHLQNQIGFRQILSEDQFNQFQQMIGGHMHGGKMGMLSHMDESALDRFPDRQALAALDLTSDQQKRMRAVIGRDPERKRIIDKLRQDSQQLLAVYSRYDLDKATARRLINSIHDSQQQLLDITYRKQQESRSILSEDQFRKLWDATVRRAKPHLRGNKPWADERT